MKRQRKEIKTKNEEEKNMTIDQFRTWHCLAISANLQLS